MTTDPLSLSPAVVPGRTAMPATGSVKGLKATIGRTGLLLAVLLIGILLAAPGLLAHVSPVATSDANLQGPSGSHLFGTDLLGRDVFSRTVYGARPVLLASLLGVLLATAAGVAIGVLGGVAPRLVNAVVMRLVDVFLALPVLLIALILIATAGSGVRSIVLAIGIAFTPGFARVVESSVRRLRKAEYVEAARVFGSTTIRTSWRHLIPNLLTEVVVLGSSAIGWGVLTATTLSFLGLGVRLPAPDWGSDLAAGATNLADAWWLSTFPGLAIMATILLANFAGDHLMRVLDPREGVRFGRLFRLVAARRSATRDGRDDR
ncbi:MULTISPECIES: ABC transporter permease [unclassified Kribbella]|uniref:ABC transporter permease n=1 Tax=unclassified Kribbella TaxID=2644121 RepID=UPI0037888CBD|nr:ABC transporter permease [Kribbella sp. NBC_00889]